MNTNTNKVTSGFIAVDTSSYTTNLPFQIETVWSAQQYLDELLAGVIRDAIRSRIESTISSFAESADLLTQNVILVDMLVSNPASATTDLRLIANLGNSQFVLLGANGETFTTKTWVEAPVSQMSVSNVPSFLPFGDFLKRSGATFLAGIDVTKDLIIHGRDVGSTVFYEEPLILPPGKELRVWLSYIVPIDAAPFSLQFENTTIPLYN